MYLNFPLASLTLGASAVLPFLLLLLLMLHAGDDVVRQNGRQQPATSQPVEVEVLKLERHLGLFSGIVLIVGNMIGNYGLLNKKKGLSRCDNVSVEKKIN